MVATITSFTNKQQPHEVLQGRVGHSSRIIDFSEHNAGVGDTVQLLEMQAGSKVHEFGVRVIIPEGGALTADFGDAANPAGYGDDEDLAIAVNSIIKTLEADTYGQGKYYDVDTFISMIPSAALDTLKLEVWANYTMSPLA